MKNNRKSGLIKARVSASMKAEMARLARERGESEAVLIREAITYYLNNQSSRPMRRH